MLPSSWNFQGTGSLPVLSSYTGQLVMYMHNSWLPISAYSKTVSVFLKNYTYPSDIDWQLIVYDEFCVFKKDILLHLSAPFFARLPKFEKKNYLCVRAIHNWKFHTCIRGSFKVYDFLRFEKYAFRLKTLSSSRHLEWEVTHWQCISSMHIHDFLVFNSWQRKDK
jgi:hypothetical protein